MRRNRWLVLICVSDKSLKRPRDWQIDDGAVLIVNSGPRGFRMSALGVCG